MSSKTVKTGLGNKKQKRSNESTIGTTLKLCWSVKSGDGTVCPRFYFLSAALISKLDTPISTGLCISFR